MPPVPEPPFTDNLQRQFFDTVIVRWIISTQVLPFVSEQNAISLRYIICFLCLLFLLNPGQPFRTLVALKSAMGQNDDHGADLTYYFSNIPLDHILFTQFSTVGISVIYYKPPKFYFRSGIYGSNYIDPINFQLVSPMKHFFRN